MTIQSNTTLLQELLAEANAMPNADDVYNDGYNVGLEKGKQAEYDAFWDAYQQNGERTDYQYAFYGWGDTFRPKYDLKPIRAEYIFAWCNVTDLETRLLDRGVVLDLSNCTNTNRAFNRIGTAGDTMDDPDYAAIIPELVLRKSANIAEMFGYANVRIIRKIILNDQGDQDTSTMFHGGCVNLEEIRFEGVIGKNLRLQWSSKLSNESVQSIIDHLKDLTGATAQTLTFHATVGANLTDTQKAAISAKNWTLVY